MSSQRLRKVVGYAFVAPALSATAFVFAISNLNGLPSRFSDQLNLKSAALLSFPQIVRGRCNEGNVLNPLSADECVLGNKNRPVDFLLVGDSHANHFTAMLDYMAKHAGIRGYDITQSSTIYLPSVKRFYVQDGQLVEHKNFELRNFKLTELIGQMNPKAVVLAGNFASYYDGSELHSDSATNSSEAFEKGIRAALENITNSGAMAFIIKGAPILQDVAQDCGLNKLRFGQHGSCDFEVTSHREYFKKWNKLVLQLQIEFPKLVVISPDEVICDNTDCHAEISGVPLYRDGGHLNHIGSELIGKLYVESFGNPLATLRGVPIASKSK